MPAHNDPTSDATLIKDLKTGMRNFTTLVIVLEISPRIFTSSDGAELRACKVADRTACINLMLADDFGCHVQPGDICRITECYVGAHDGSPTLYIGKGGILLKVMEFSMIFNEQLNMSEPTTPGSGPRPQVIASGPALVNSTGSNNHASSSTPMVKID